MNAPALVTALLGWALVATPSPLQLGPGKRVLAAADRVAWSEDGQRLEARGAVELVSDSLTVRSDALDYDVGSGEVVARGHVLFVSFPYLGVADEARVDAEGKEAHFKGALFFRKSGVTESALRAARTLDDVRRLGQTELMVSGSAARRLAADTWEVEDVAFTPCDCDPTQASWKIEARRGNFQAGERAILEWTRVSVRNPPLVGAWVQELPVLPPLPWMYVPLSPRRSGLLIPRVQGTPLSGLMVEQPVFWTLGESHDLTLSPAWFFGNPASVYGVQGPRLHGEYRYVPSEQTSGRATAALLWDLRTQRDPLRASRAALFPTASGALAERERGLRGEFSASHVQRFGEGWAARADLAAVSDGHYVRDVTPDVLGREAQYLRSAATLSNRGADHWVGMDAVVRQDLRFGHALFGGDRDFRGTEVPGLRTLQRFPAVRAELLERPLAGPVTWSVSSAFVRVAPLWGLTGDEGRDGQLDPLRPDADGSQGDGAFQAGEREARMRLDLLPRVAASGRLGNVASVSSWAAWRQDVWVGEGSGRVDVRGYPLAGLRAESRLVGVFGEGARQVRHVVEPAVELRSLPVVLGAAPAVAYDELDAPAAGPFPLQGIASVRQRLLRANGAERARLEVGQGASLAGGRLAESFGRLSLEEGPFRLTGLARFDPVRARWTQLNAGLRIGSSKRGLYATYERLLLSGTERTRRGVDELVGTAAPPGEPSVADQLNVGGAWAFASGVGLRYDAIFGPLEIPTATSGGTAASFRQQALGLSYGPACDCWRFEGQLVARPNAAVPGGISWQFGLSLTLAGFGTFGTGG
ncbi:MAG: hypothetical protein RL653_1220 [Pseudomonadota bacterium]